MSSDEQGQLADRDRQGPTHDVRSLLVADHQWAGRWVTAEEVLALRQAQGATRQAQGAGDATLRQAQGTEGAVRIGGTLVPGLRDHHVHLGLIDRAALAGSALSAVDDLGWIPREVLAWRATRPGGCAVRVAGPFLTAPGGYPFGRAWAPAEAVVAVSSPSSGSEAVSALAAAGVDLIKVALHTGLPLLDDVCLAAIVDAAHRAGRPVVVHVEGSGQAARAFEAGADTLAHTPWTERLSDRLLEEMAGKLTWISTLAIHPADSRARSIAADNLVRFVSSGGEIRYGTDMGNGPTPVGLSTQELEALVAAGLETATIMAALCRADPDGDADSEYVTWTPLAPPSLTDDLPQWCATLRRRRLSDFSQIEVP